MAREPFTRTTLVADLSAAATVALVGLPQCLAYALMSGLPPVYGLVTAAVPGFVAALLGKSPFVVTGPTNTTGLLILAALGPHLGAGGLLEPSGLAVLASLTWLAGLIRIAAALSGGAALVDFIPESVLTGFTSGAAVLIVAMQLDEALGLGAVRGAGLFAQLSQLAHALEQSPAAPIAVATAAGTTLAVVLGKRFVPRLPAALVAVVAATLVASALGLDASSGLPVVGDKAQVAVGWPAFAWPSLDPSLLRELLGPAAAIALLGTIELAVSARRGGARPDMRREIVAQGLANVVGAPVGAFPASASLTRSALLELGGARTRLAAALAALAMVPILLFGGGLVASMPLASLAGVLFAVAAGMIDRERVQRMWNAAPATRLLLVVTFVATLVLPLEWAIFSGVGLGLAHHLATTRAPRIERLVPSGDRLVPLPIDADPSTPVLVLEISGDCHFAASGLLLERVESSVPPGAGHVVLDLSHAHALRFAALLAFEKLSRDLRARGTRLWLAGVEPDFAKLLSKTGSHLPVEPYTAEPTRSVRAVLAKIAAADAPSDHGTEIDRSDTDGHIRA